MKNKDTAKVLADYIRASLKAQKSNGFTLSKRAGLAQSNISRILNCQTTPTLDVLEKLAAGLGVSLSEMLAGVPPPPPPEPEPEPPGVMADAKRVARLATAFAKCDERSQRIVLDLVEKLAGLNVKLTAAD